MIHHLLLPQEGAMHITFSSHNRFSVSKLLFLLFAITMLGVLNAATAEDMNIYGVAIEGYDTVAYFTEERAMRGDPDIHHDWNEARWHFATVEHRDMFAADPKKFAPSHAGF
jgi:hypothetical protein